MEVAITGLVTVTGEQDTGKTTFAITAGPHPKDIVFIDLDLKAETLHKQLTFGEYFSPLRMGKVKESPLDVYETMVNILESIKHVPLIIIDGFERFEYAINAWADENMTEISPLSAGQIQKMSRLTWPYKYRHYSKIIAMWLEKCDLAVFTTHLKDDYNHPGRKLPRGQNPLFEASSLRLWLLHNPNGPVPIGLVSKRPTLAVWNEKSDEIEPVNMIPRKLNPCNWKRVRYYKENPIGDKQPPPEEILTHNELALLDGILTDDQRMAMKLALKKSEQEDMDFESTEAIKYESKSEIVFNEETVVELVKQGKSAPEIARQTGFRLPEVLKVVNGMESE